MKLKNQKGQLALEAVLLMTILISATLLGIRYLRENQVLAKLVESPWDRTAGMIETGIWAPPAQVQVRVPYSYSRYYTPVVK